MLIAVAATPEVAIPTLELLLQRNENLAAVITQPDRPAGRGLAIKESAVAVWARHHKIRAFKPESQEELAAIAADFDLIITIGFGMIIREEILALPKFGFINLHFSLLPRWRGAAPVQRAIEAGDMHTGVSVFKLDRGMDTGPIYRQKQIEIAPDATTESLLRELSEIGAETVLETISDIRSAIFPTAQDADGATRANKLSKEEGRIDWSMSALAIDRKIRAFYPNPGSWTTFRGSSIKILKVEISSNKFAEAGQIRIIDRQLIVSCGDLSLKVIDIQPSGKPVMAATAWVNGAALKTSERFE